MDDDGGFSSRVGDARVALACEMFTLDELRMDRLHDVYSFRIHYEDVEDCKDDGDGKSTTQSSGATTTTTTTEVNPLSTMELEAHPDDSISDLKRQIQSSFMDEWGLKGRRLDRDQIATGWELIKVNPGSATGLGHDDDDDDDDDGHVDNVKKGRGRKKANTAAADTKEDSLGVMSYHLFLHSYDVRHGDVIHAVVRSYEEGDHNVD